MCFEMYMCIVKSTMQINWIQTFEVSSIQILLNNNEQWFYLKYYLLYRFIINLYNMLNNISFIINEKSLKRVLFVEKSCLEFLWKLI